MHSESKSGPLNKAKGNADEKTAVQFLEKIGYNIIRVHFGNEHREIYIVAENESGVLNFIEVKSRFGNKFEKPAEALDKNKRNKIIKVSRLYMSGLNINKRPVSYGLISIKFTEQGGIILIYFEYACD